MEFKVVRDVEGELMPTLHETCQNLRAELPAAKIRVFSSTGGTGTPDPWHVLGVSCRLADLPDRMVEVAILIDICRLNSQPNINAQVMWDFATLVGLNDEFVQVETKLFSRPVPVSDEAVQMVKASLPLLVPPLKKAVERRFPRKKLSPDVKS